MKTDLPAWHAEMADELNAVMAKYIRIARAENQDARAIYLSLLAMFANRVVHVTPVGGEKLTMLIMRDCFDDYRPGWRRNP